MATSLPAVPPALAPIAAPITLAIPCGRCGELALEFRLPGNLPAVPKDATFVLRNAAKLLFRLVPATWRGVALQFAEHAIASRYREAATMAAAFADQASAMGNDVVLCGVCVRSDQS